MGWYHSHPGYGCWLSGIDCTTQMTNQQYQVRKEGCLIIMVMITRVHMSRLLLVIPRQAVFYLQVTIADVFISSLHIGAFPGDCG